MKIAIGYDTYKFYNDYNGVTCDKETANLLNLKVGSDQRCTLQNYDMFLALIANKHNMTINEVKKFDLKNQDCK